LGESENNKQYESQTSLMCIDLVQDALTIKYIKKW